MGNLLKLLAISAFVILLINACSKPSTLGSELLDIDQEDVEFTDTIQILTSTVLRDSVLAFNLAGPFRSFTLGNYQDPNFGSYKSDGYIQISPANTNIPPSAGLRVDSVFLSLSIDSVMTKGDFTTNLQFELYEVSDSFDREGGAFSNEHFPTFPEILGTYDGKPSLTDRSIIYDEAGDTLINDFLVKIPLDTVLGKKLIDSFNISNFDQEFFGLYLKTLNSSPSESILSITAESNSTRLVVYYSNVVDTVVSSGQYPFVISPIDFRSNNIERDISGTIVESYLNGTNTDSDVAFVQGVAGPEVKVDISQISDLGSILVNSATIEFTAKNIDGMMSSEYPAVDDLIFAKLNEDNQFTGIDDNILGQAIFGGEFEEAMSNPNSVLGTYSLDISDYVQKIIDGQEDPILYLRTLPKISNTDRTVIFGHESMDYKPKLELTFTRINQ